MCIITTIHHWTCVASHFHRLWCHVCLILCEQNMRTTSTKSLYLNITLPLLFCTIHSFLICDLWWCSLIHVILVFYVHFAFSCLFLYSRIRSTLTQPLKYSLLWTVVNHDLQLSLMYSTLYFIESISHYICRWTIIDEFSCSP